MNELVTGDAVVLGLRPAKLPSRALAVFIDLVVVWAGYIVVSMVLAFAASSLDTAAVAALAVASFLLIPVGVPIAVETLSQGRSLGKLACGLRVVRDDGGPIRFRHALVRGAVGVVELLMSFGVIACVASLASARGRRVGDLFAGTLVVRERVPADRAQVVPPPPPWLVGRFSQLDFSSVPDELWLAVRQYLTRMSQLDANVGSSMAQRLADDLAARTGVPLPPDVPPMAFLAAVVSERQSRDARRAFGAVPTPGGTPPARVGGPSAPSPRVGRPERSGPPVARPDDIGPGTTGTAKSASAPAGSPAPAPGPGRGSDSGSGFAPPA
ncbi:RDD family protein [Streptomyces sp. NBC_01498]|uniref:RDD family protein n=1 Tax=Streptomyces sp. NBC_01498 TaxID=2975870 RepID=UPI002E7B10B2|nr:RDD family protein [Streptomyces sp. NBC_01498]WTL26596.1 RDD family protein [Streptomyces sp. NBC_01498]